MVNFVSSYHFCLFFCFFTQIFSFNSVEAKTQIPSNFEFNVDVNAIMNCNNLDDQIDNFINVGIQYQQATTKKFKYKKFLKFAYTYLEKQGVKVDKKVKKRFEKTRSKKINISSVWTI